jgi:hypothetical protein
MQELYLFGDEPVRLPESTIEQCHEFSKALDLRYYIKNRKADPKKVIYQAFYSKVCEHAICSFLNNKFGPTTAPDMKIYAAKDKSWDSDLKLIKDKTYNVHCKSWDSHTAATYGASASFNYSNKKGRGGLDNLFTDRSPDDLISFAEFNEEDESVKVCALAKWSLLREKDLFRNPAVKWLIGTKMVVYLDDLRSLGLQTWGEASNNVF